MMVWEKINPVYLGDILNWKSYNSEKNNASFSFGLLLSGSVLKPEKDSFFYCVCVLKHL